jgi:hypothetical protein
MKFQGKFLTVQQLSSQDYEVYMYFVADVKTPRVHVNQKAKSESG